MSNEKKKPDEPYEQLASAGSFLVTTLAWLQVFISPVIAGGFLGGFIYFYRNQSEQALIYGSIVFAAGVTVGIFFADYVRRKIGLVEFVSRRIATPDFDKKPK